MKEGNLTYEEIVEQLLGELFAASLVQSGERPSWPAFLRLSDRVHERFCIPNTTITPMMRRLLFGIGMAARPRCLAVVGSYIGYGMAWLLRDGSDPQGGPFAERAYGIDVDVTATELAAENLSCLGHAESLRLVADDAIAFLPRIEQSLDLLFLDLDDPVTGKAGYADALLAARPKLNGGALVIGHDPCVPRFAADFDTYHQLVSDEPWIEGPWVLPVDECGLTIAVVGEGASEEIRDSTESSSAAEGQVWSAR